MNERSFDTLLQIALDELADENLAAVTEPTSSTPVIGEKTIKKCKRMFRWNQIKRSVGKGLKAFGTLTAACFIVMVFLFTSGLSIPPERDFFCMVTCEEDEEGFHMYFDLEVSENLWKDRKPTYIPKGWTMEKHEASDGVFSYNIYGTGDEYISFKQYYSDFEVNFNTKPEFEKITLRTGVECGYYKSGNMKVFTWYDNACLYFVKAWDIDKELVIEIIESVR